MITKHFIHPKQVLSNNYSQKTTCSMEVALIVVNPYDYNPFSCPLDEWVWGVMWTPFNLHGTWLCEYTCDSCMMPCLN